MPKENVRQCPGTCLLCRNAVVSSVQTQHNCFSCTSTNNNNSHTKKGTQKKAVVKCSDILRVQLELQEMTTGHFQLFLEESFKEHFSSRIRAGLQSLMLKYPMMKRSLR